MIKTMKYINLSDLAAALNIENETEFLFFWDNTNDNNGTFLFCNEERLQGLIEYVKYLEETNPNHRYLQRAKNEISAINLLRTKYGITDKIFVVYFD